MFEAVADGRIKAIWIMATNPGGQPARRRPRARGAGELPVRGRLRLHAPDRHHAPTPHVQLPALAWGEKDGTVTNSERRISRQRAVPAGARRGARRLADHRRRRQAHGLLPRLSTIASAGRDLPRACRAVRLSRTTARATSNLGARARSTIDAYDALAPVQWPVTRNIRPARRGCSRRPLLHARPQGALRPVAPRRAAECDQPRLSAGAQHRPRPRPVAHHDAHREDRRACCAHRSSPTPNSIPRMRARQGLQDGALARLRAVLGRDDRARRSVSAEQRRGCVFVPMHWNERVCRRWARQRAGQSRDRSDLRTARIQAHAGQGRALSAEMACLHPQPQRDRRRRPADTGCAARRAIAGGMELAGDERPESWRDWARAQLGA